MRLRLATLIKTRSDNGLWEVKNHVRVGTRYCVDLDSQQTVRCLHVPTQTLHEAELIDVYDDESGQSFAGIYPTALLTWKKQEEL